MNRCLSCNSLLAKQELVCSDCGYAAVVPNRLNIPRVLNTALSVLFYVALGTTIASFFLPDGPSTMICGVLTVSLLFVKRSAKDAVEKTSRQ
jgi:hypothetical protein